MTPLAATALIAEDEPLLAQALALELARAWPQLRIVATVGDGASAAQQALALRPDVLFFDIRMPAMGGIEAAAALADEWPADQPFPALVFVTAYDQYAVQAFEARAVDYLLKPVQPQRLARCVERLQALLAQRPSGAVGLDAAIDALRHLLAEQDRAKDRPAAAAPEPLTVIQASVGTTLHMVPIDDVLLLDAADKYVRVIARERQYLIRTPLKDLLPRLNAHVFWQVHRGAVVRASAIETVHRDAAGRLSLTLRGHAERVPVSRLYAHLFKAM